MRVFYQLNELPQFKRAVLTIGSFDGVHCGHQQLLARINRLARQIDGESIVVTFHPHPRQVIYPRDNSLQLLSTIEEKVALFEHYGVDNVVVVPFTVAFSQLSADEYIERFLVETFHPQTIVIGYDHKFGLNRQGDIDYLKWHSKKAGYEVVEIPPREINDIAVSSTKIRNALQQGRVKEAARFLGHPYEITGKVVHGQHLGTQLGFPTANVQPDNRFKLIPAQGIYAVWVRHQGEIYGGMLYIGNRPSIADAKEHVIEVHIFAFNKNIYGDELTVVFVDYLRADVKFQNLAELKAQLAEDREDARAILSQEQPGLLAELPGPELAIVILNYNGAAYLQEFLPSVLASVAGTPYQVIVADNASTDASLAILAASFPEVRCIVLKENLGFAADYNEALQQVNADYFVLLNSDVKVAPDWIAPCLQVLEHNPGIAACQPKILAYQQPDTFEYAGAAGGWLDILGYPFCRGRIFNTTEKDEGQYDEPVDIFWASGAALFIKADIFRAFGGFDAAYFAHAEEIDLCWRLKRAGYRIVVVPQAVVYHLGGGTLEYLSPKKTYLNFRNTLITSFKNEPLDKLVWWLPLRLLMDGLAGFLFLIQGKWAHIGAIIKAHWHFFPRLVYWYQRKIATDKLVAKFSIGKFTQAGIYSGSIVWAYYALGKRSFQSLAKRRLHEETKG